MWLPVEDPRAKSSQELKTSRVTSSLITCTVQVGAHLVMHQISTADRTHARTGPDTQRAQAHHHTQNSKSRTHTNSQTNLTFTRTRTSQVKSSQACSLIGSLALIGFIGSGGRLDTTGGLTVLARPGRLIPACSSSQGAGPQARQRDAASTSLELILGRGRLCPPLSLPQFPHLMFDAGRSRADFLFVVRVARSSAEIGPHALYFSPTSTSSPRERRSAPMTCRL